MQPVKRRLILAGPKAATPHRSFAICYLSQAKEEFLYPSQGAQLFFQTAATVFSFETHRVASPTFGHKLFSYWPIISTNIVD